MGKGEIILNRKVMIGAAVAVVIIAVFAFTQMQPGKESAGKVDLNSLTVAEKGAGRGSGGICRYARLVGELGRHLDGPQG